MTLAKINPVPIVAMERLFPHCPGTRAGAERGYPDRCEALHHWLYDLSREAPFAVATTEAPHFRRVTYMRMRAEGISLVRIRQTPVGRGFGIRDGNGIMFIGHNGEIYPAGFLPLVAGNTRTAHIVEIYRESELFRKIRRRADLRDGADVASSKTFAGAHGQGPMQPTETASRKIQPVTTNLPSTNGITSPDLRIRPALLLPRRRIIKAPGS